MCEETEFRKYPRTPHLEGSRLQPGDEDLSQVPFGEIRGRHVVVEEKCDGANSAVSFTANGELRLQSRGHYLTGGYRERHFNLMKQWAGVHKDAFYAVLGSRYIMYGEWMYAKHTVFYDRLPGYFLEFDIYDRQQGIYLDTPSRRVLTRQMPVVCVPVLADGVFQKQEDILTLLGESWFISADHTVILRETAQKLGLDPERQCQETDSSRLMEGLYLKIEEEGAVKMRLKYVRASFLQTVDASETHWLERPIVPNQLCVPVNAIFEGI